MSVAPRELSSREVQKRVLDYKIAFKQLQRVLPQSWQVIICENTLGANESSLTSILDFQRGPFPISSLSANSGEINKGIGELDMMVNAATDFPELLRNSRTVSYFTGRRIVTNRYIFERTENLTSEALISNPDFFYLDGTIVETEKQYMYNDMFFSMKSRTFLDYVEFFKSNREKMIELGVGSEQNLFDFMKKNGIGFEWLNELGLLRREKQTFFRWFQKDRIHIC
ncbi:hypothetical protein [Candidatus Planktophila versatilis]|nr:hypothetical protein [Candidatus Planktophila versatilis]